MSQLATGTVRPRKGVTPHAAPSGAGHFYCDSRWVRRIEQNGTKGIPDTTSTDVAPLYVACESQAHARIALSN